MKKKSFIFCILFLLSVGCLSVIADSWDDFANVNQMWYGQKAITDKDFENVMDALQQKQKQKEEKINKKKIKKISGGGNSLHKELDPSKNINKNDMLKINNDGVIVNVPVRLFADGGIIEKGYYKIKATKENDNLLYIVFYQSHFVKGKIKATETDDDYGEENIDFAKILPYNEGIVKLIYGSAEYNAYAYIQSEIE